MVSAVDRTNEIGESLGVPVAEQQGYIGSELVRSVLLESRRMSSLAADQSHSTSVSLLARVGRREADAWERFAALYTPLVYGWARRGGLQASDAADVVQDVFRAVFQKIENFQRDGQQSRFRGWLWTITRNRVRLHYRQAAPQAQGAGGSEAARRLEQVPELLESEDEPAAEQTRQVLVHRALQLIKQDFAADTWQAFWRLAVDGDSAQEIAAELGCSVAAVRQAKYRVLCRLREELAGF